MLKISYAGRFGLSEAASAQFTIEICVTAWNREKFTKNPFWGSRSFKVIDVDNPGKRPHPSAVVIPMSSKSESYLQRSQARPANSGKKS